MSDTKPFIDLAVTSVATWHGVKPPSEVALRMMQDLAASIRDFEALRGTLKFEDEPSSFESALTETAAIEVVP